MKRVSLIQHSDSRNFRKDYIKIMKNILGWMVGGYVEMQICWLKDYINFVINFFLIVWC